MRSTVAFGLVLVSFVLGCGSEGPTAPPGPASVSTVVVSPNQVTMYVGQTRQLAVTLADASGTVLTGRTVTWTSADTTRARVTPTGLVTAVAPGTATITVSSEGKSAPVSVTVALVPVSTVTVTGMPTRFFVGDTVRLRAVAADSAGGTLPGRPVLWNSDNPAVATVDGLGLTRALSTGTARITATAEGKSGSVSVTVALVPVSTVTVSGMPTKFVVGDTVRLRAVAADSAGNTLAGRRVVWSSDNPGVATVDSLGLTRALAAGSVRISATAEGKAGSASLAVLPPAAVASVTILLPSDIIVSGATTEVARAVTLAANGDTLRGRTVTWSTSAPSVTTIDAAGRISALAAGAADLIATVEGKTARKTVTIEDRSKYTTATCEFCIFKPNEDIRHPAWDPVRQGTVPNPRDARQQIVIDQTFTVPAGREVVWEDKIVWIRPTARQNILIHGKLTIRNSSLFWDQTEHQQSRLDIQSGGTLQIENSYSFQSNPFWVNWEYRDGSTVLLDHYQGDPWTSLNGSVTYRAVNGSSVRMTLLESTRSSNITVRDAHTVWLELFMPAGTHEISFPAKRQWHDWSIPSLWPSTTLDVKSSFVWERDATLVNGAHVTVKDTPSGFGVGWTIFKNSPGLVQCELRDLGDPQNDDGVMYVDKKWDLPCTNSSLTVKNSKLQRVWLSPYGAVQLKVYRSNLVDPRNYGGLGALLEIYDSTIDHLAAYNGGKAYAENSAIRYDVEAVGQGTEIYGYNLRDRDNGAFKIYENGGGKYIRLTTPGAPWNK